MSIGGPNKSLKSGSGALKITARLFKMGQPGPHFVYFCSFQK